MHARMKADIIEAQTWSGNMCFWRKTFARVTIACWTRSCELPGPPGQGSVRMRFAASVDANATTPGPNRTPVSACLVTAAAALTTV